MTFGEMLDRELQKGEKQGFLKGEKQGEEKLAKALLDQGLITEEALEKVYKLKK